MSEWTEDAVAAEPVAAQNGARNVLSEIESVGSYLHGLMGEEDLPGRGENRRHLDGALDDMKRVAENIVGLEADYASGVTHKQRLENTSGPLRDDQVAHLGLVDEGSASDKAKIADLERQLAALKGGN